MIRAAAPADDAAICAIINAVVDRPDVTFRAVHRTVEEITQMRTAAPTFVADINGQIAGYASYGPFRSGEGYASCVEHSIALAPGREGQGLGRALMTALIDAARTANLHTMVAGVSAANPPAIAFHAALGFAPAGTLPQIGQKAGQWQDLIFMVKRLDDRPTP